MIQKVLAYILNTDDKADRLLAYSHKNFPEVPLLVPGGTIQKGEAPLEALKREVREESGLTDLYDIEKLGEADIYNDEKEDYHGHFFRCRTDHELTEWEYKVQGDGEDRGLIFCYEWLQAQEALLVHDYYFHVYMRAEYLPTLFSEDSLLGLSNKNISLMPHTELWKECFENEKNELERRIAGLEIEHVGSTAIPWIPAKPIIDIVMSVGKPERVIEDIEDCGYEYMVEKGVKGRFYFVKGQEENRTHHIHLFEKDNQRYQDHLLFRDYLTENRDLAERYGKLKLELWRKNRGERRKYTEEKSDFITHILDKARSEM